MKELQFEKHDNVKGAVKSNTLRRFKEEKINDGIYECEECSNHGYIIYFDENDEMNGHDEIMIVHNGKLNEEVLLAD